MSVSWFWYCWTATENVSTGEAGWRRWVNARRRTLYVSASSYEFIVIWETGWKKSLREALYADSSAYLPNPALINTLNGTSLTIWTNNSLLDLAQAEVASWHLWSLSVKITPVGFLSPPQFSLSPLNLKILSRSVPGGSNLWASLGHTGRRVVLGHILNTNT